MSTSNPISPKVTASTIAAPVAVAATAVLVYVVESTAGIDIPELVEGSIAVLLAAAGAFVAGYVKRDPARHVDE